MQVGAVNTASGDAVPVQVQADLDGVLFHHGGIMVRDVIRLAIAGPNPEGDERRGVQEPADLSRVKHTAYFAVLLYFVKSLPPLAFAAAPTRA